MILTQCCLALHVLPPESQPPPQDLPKSQPPPLDRSLNSRVIDRHGCAQEATRAMTWSMQRSQSEYACPFASLVVLRAHREGSPEFDFVFTHEGEELHCCGTFSRPSPCYIRPVSNEPDSVLIEFEDDKNHKIPLTLDQLRILNLDMTRLEGSQKCRGTTRKNKPCANMTLSKYSKRGDSVYLCWRHSSQFDAIVAKRRCADV